MLQAFSSTPFFVPHVQRPADSKHIVSIMLYKLKWRMINLLDVL
jgi:hypothetical protein